MTNDWTGTFTFGPWWLLYCGPIGPTGLHTHEAFQIVVTDSTSCVLDGAGKPIEGPIAIVDPDQPHAIRDGSDRSIVVFVEPNSTAGASLRCRGSHPTTGSPHPLSEILAALATANWSRSEEAVRRTLAMAGVSEPVIPMRWWRHPTVDEALLHLPEQADDGRVAISELAATLGVSTTKLTHLFSAEVGIPLGPYARWIQLVRATERLVDGLSLTEAALAARFSDGAHFSRVFGEMFGMTPSEVMLSSSWLR